jgi:DNA polymerase-3 subunit delta'
MLAAPLGQGPALAQLLRRARSLGAPHAMLFEGSRGCGKTTVMRWIAAALLCPSDLDPDAPCGVCRTCSRIAAGTFPDVLLVDRAKDEAEQKELKKSLYVIKVAQVREAQERLVRHAVEGRARVLLMSDADTMEEEAQNALLKTLEEPGADTFLLLEARRPEQLLPTVRSRVQRLRVVPLSEATLRAEMQRRIPERSAHFDTAVALADGSLGQSLRAATERAVQIHDLVRAALATTKGLRPVATARAVLEGVRERREETEAVRTFLWLLRSELRRRRDALASGTSGAYFAASEPWTSWLEQALLAERDLDLRIPPEQVLTACLAGFVA